MVKQLILIILITFVGLLCINGSFSQSNLRSTFKHLFFMIRPHVETEELFLDYKKKIELVNHIEFNELSIKIANAKHYYLDVSKNKELSLMCYLDDDAVEKRELTQVPISRKNLKKFLWKYYFD